MHTSCTALPPWSRTFGAEISRLSHIDILLHPVCLYKPMPTPEPPRQPRGCSRLSCPSGQVRRMSFNCACEALRLATSSGAWRVAGVGLWKASVSAAWVCGCVDAHVDADLLGTLSVVHRVQYGRCFEVQSVLPILPWRRSADATLRILMKLFSFSTI
ncbi:hypothetical protein KC19_1G286400 [Ceratodon purpureus]|uniref:Uncharacterized protein n=1 Tax=Ceratodon purpureus TaxID=3225 RepID=A0A8T0JBK9_CERPU|nr:hypothetical protein KC19_1G286000 [Ceratodon purpureus]KAG0592865.1 hypothetical protein KC19_1G286100 [Ceratodon purpureus]KAG0592868.1 hypothetical protein KC19_1G286400 [Ceratodon purpureus]